MSGFYNKPFRRKASPKISAIAIIVVIALIVLGFRAYLTNIVEDQQKNETKKNPYQAHEKEAIENITSENSIAENKINDTDDQSNPSNISSEAEEDQKSLQVIQNDKIISADNRGAGSLNPESEIRKRDYDIYPPNKISKSNPSMNAIINSSREDVIYVKDQSYPKNKEANTRQTKKKWAKKSLRKNPNKEKTNTGKLRFSNIDKTLKESKITQSNLLKSNLKKSNVKNPKDKNKELWAQLEKMIKKQKPLSSEHRSLFPSKKAEWMVNNAEMRNVIAAEETKSKKRKKDSDLD